MVFDNLHGFHFYQQHLLKVMLASRPLSVEDELGLSPHHGLQAPLYGFKLTLPRPASSAFAPPAAVIERQHPKSKVRCHKQAQLMKRC